jgi:hypothetical protein
MYQKLRELYNKHAQNGTPRNMIEANMSREFRLCRDELKKVMGEMDLEAPQKRHVKRVRLQPQPKDTYDLQMSR